MSQPMNPYYVPFEESFRKNYAPLCRHAYNFLRDKEAAEDLIQDLFVKVWEDRPEIFADPKLSVSYLYTAAKNNCISVLRKKVVIVPVEDEGELDVAMTDDHHLHEERELLYKQIFEAIEQLPPKCAAAFKMHRTGEMSYKQIAEEMGISVKTVENQIGKALKLIRQATLQPQLSSWILIAILWICKK